MGRWGVWLIGLGWAQLPARYVVQADVVSWVWGEYRASGEYRLFREAPPFEGGVLRPRLEGLTSTLGLSYVRKLPLRGFFIRPGIKYYGWRPRYAPAGLWVGFHGLIGGVGAFQEPSHVISGLGISLGYQYIFRQSYGALLDPYLMWEWRFSRAWREAPLQVGLRVGLASRRWQRRVTR